MPARRAYAFLSDGLAVGRWALGSFAARKVGPNLFRGRSLFDGTEVLYRPVGDATRLIVDYHVGTSPKALAPRVMARVVPGEATGRDKSSPRGTREAEMPEASMDWDDERPRPKPTITVGEKLDQHSVADLEERIVALTTEIERVKAELQTKKARAAAADALFKG